MGVGARAAVGVVRATRTSPENSYFSLIDVWRDDVRRMTSVDCNAHARAVDLSQCFLRGRVYEPRRFVRARSCHDLHMLLDRAEAAFRRPYVDASRQRATSA